MFELTEADLCRRILGCADGPASFNAETTRRGGQVVSCDPLYQFDREQIRARIAAVYDDILEQTRQNQQAFVWDRIRSIDHLAQVRMEAMEIFLADYDDGKRDGRYVEGTLPALPFADGSFDLAICSHFLFLYSAHLSESFHVQAVAELCRVATEVRIFPLVTLAGEPSVYVDAVLDWASSRGLTSSIQPASYEFQRGGNRMLRIVWTKAWDLNRVASS
jgi:hypothetical protein